jgi:nuclear pore complex protein Nup43
MNLWLTSERINNKISVRTVVDGLRKSINSFDLEGDKIICACDNEAVYMIDNIN